MRGAPALKGDVFDTLPLTIDLVVFSPDINDIAENMHIFNDRWWALVTLILVSI